MKGRFWFGMALAGAILLLPFATFFPLGGDGVLLCLAFASVVLGATTGLELHAYGFRRSAAASVVAERR